MRLKYVKVGRYETWCGAYVQVPGFPGRLFSLSKYGSWAACHRAARAHRDPLARRMKPFPPRAQRRPSRRSHLQILGVSPERTRRPSRRVTGYRAQMTRRLGRWRRSARFSLSRSAAALDRAVAARRRFEREWAEEATA